MFLARLLIFMLVAVCPTAAFAQGFTVPATRSHQVDSEILGESFEIVVALPFSYEASDRDFPLLISLDGDAMFGMSAEIPRLLSFESKVPQMITASVVYGNLNRWIAARQRDFHPADGGAEKFLSVLKREVIPFLQNNYRVEENSRALYGHSSGGLFAFYAGLREPALFSRILATSPSLEEEPDWAATFPGLIQNNQSGLPRMFVSADVGEQAMIAALQPSIEAFKAKAPETSLSFQLYDEGGHMAVIPKAFTAGLHFLFAR